MRSSFSKSSATQEEQLKKMLQEEASKQAEEWQARLEESRRVEEAKLKDLDKKYQEMLKLREQDKQKIKELEVKQARDKEEIK